MGRLSIIGRRALAEVGISDGKVDRAVAGSVLATGSVGSLSLMIIGLPVLVGLAYTAIPAMVWFGIKWLRQP